MFLFAHVGITLGLATLVSGAIREGHRLGNSSPAPRDPVLSGKNLNTQRDFRGNNRIEILIRISGYPGINGWFVVSRSYR